MKTNDKIREEKLNTLKSMLWELGHTDKDAHHVIEYVDELLKSQRDGLVEKIKKLNDFADSGDTLKSRIINLIKNN